MLHTGVTQDAAVEDEAVKTCPEVGAVAVFITISVVAECNLSAAIVFVVESNVLFVNVCVSVVPITEPTTP